MSEKKIVKVVVVVKDGTISRAYADADIKLVVVEPELVADGLCECVWEHFVGDLDAIEMPMNLSKEIASALL
jgi:hypothetical protein